jgi:hypothetical protein
MAQIGLHVHDLEGEELPLCFEVSQLEGLEHS